ncbi:hypothetical protein ERHA54_34890 [Erwinia rhapontici]|nr:hypothetical protein EDF84_101426 [Erwinia rhapontici]BCQ40886.1 hypothetical protein ERHA54_34890 [Erwinia rhapontici]
MENNDTQTLDYWIHPYGFIYIGDQIEGARAATDGEIAAHLAEIMQQEP